MPDGTRRYFSLFTLQETKIDPSNGHLSGEKDDQPVDLGVQNKPNRHTQMKCSKSSTNSSRKILN